MDESLNVNKVAGAPSGLNVGLGIGLTFPEELIMKSEKQKTLEINGCVFIGQELLDNHEIDIENPCYCNRPNKTHKAAITGELK